MSRFHNNNDMTNLELPAYWLNPFSDWVIFFHLERRAAPMESLASLDDKIIGNFSNNRANSDF